MLSDKVAQRPATMSHHAQPRSATRSLITTVAQRQSRSTISDDQSLHILRLTVAPSANDSLRDQRVIAALDCEIECLLKAVLGGVDQQIGAVILARRQVVEQLLPRLLLTTESHCQQIREQHPKQVLQLECNIQCNPAINRKSLHTSANTTSKHANDYKA
jgi:hypothetical protein